MRRTNLPYLEFKTVKGRPYIYFRRGKTRHRLPDNPDSEEFFREYWKLRSGLVVPKIKSTWDALIIRYLGSPAFRKLARSTQSDYRRHCDAIREKNGPKDVRRFRRKHALAARDALQATWSKANERVAVLSILCRFAVDLEWIDRNPVTDIPKLKGGEHKAWPDDKLRAFEGYCDANTDKPQVVMARTAFELGIGTGQRIGDCAKMLWSDFDGEYMDVVQEKTGTKVTIYCPRRLQTYLDSLPRTGKHILARNLTQPAGKRAVQKAVEWVRDAIGARAGDDRLVPHGWRYTAARELAEAGVSDADIQAVTGHKTLAMVQKYRAQANQKKASRRAQMQRERNINGT